MQLLKMKFSIQSITGFLLLAQMNITQFILICSPFHIHAKVPSSLRNREQNIDKSSSTKYFHDHNLNTTTVGGRHGRQLDFLQAIGGTAEHVMSTVFMNTDPKRKKFFEDHGISPDDFGKGKGEECSILVGEKSDCKTRYVCVGGETKRCQDPAGVAINALCPGAMAFMASPIPFSVLFAHDNPLRKDLLSFFANCHIPMVLYGGFSVKVAAGYGVAIVNGEWLETSGATGDGIGSGSFGTFSSKCETFGLSFVTSYGFLKGVLLNGDIGDFGGEGAGGFASVKGVDLTFGVSSSNKPFFEVGIDISEGGIDAFGGFQCLTSTTTTLSQGYEHKTEDDLKNQCLNSIGLATTGCVQSAPHSTFSDERRSDQCGNCEIDDHCVGNLVCLRNKYRRKLPSCGEKLLQSGCIPHNLLDIKEVRPDTKSNVVRIVSIDIEIGNGVYRLPLYNCEGTCARDSDCEGFLVCFSGTEDAAPGCEDQNNLNIPHCGYRAMDYVLGTEGTVDCPELYIQATEEQCLAGAKHMARTDSTKVWANNGQWKELRSWVSPYDQSGCLIFGGNEWNHFYNKRSFSPQGGANRFPVCAQQLFTLGDDQTRNCPTGYKNVNDKDECFVAVEYLTLDLDLNWAEMPLTTFKSWATSWDQRGCVVYQYYGKWYYFYNTGGSETSQYNNRKPVCMLSVSSTV